MQAYFVNYLLRLFARTVLIGGVLIGRVGTQQILNFLYVHAICESATFAAVFAAVCRIL